MRWERDGEVFRARGASATQYTVKRGEGAWVLECDHNQTMKPWVECVRPDPAQAQMVAEKREERIRRSRAAASPFDEPELEEAEKGWLRR